MGGRGAGGEAERGCLATSGGGRGREAGCVAGTRPHVTRQVQRGAPGAAVIWVRCRLSAVAQ